MENYSISPKDREVLRSLAAKVAQYAADPMQDKKRKLWTMHNDLKTDEPVVFIDPENGWNEIFPADALQCESELARKWEMALRKSIYHVENLKDDMVVDDVFGVPFVVEKDGWGLPVVLEGGKDGGAYHIKPAIEDYEDVFDQIHFPNYTINRSASDALLNQAHDTFDGLLKVKPKQIWWWSLGLTWWYIDLRGLEDFLCDLVVDPEWVHKMMNLLCDGTLHWLDQMEEQGTLFSNVGNTYVGSGGFGFTEQLPQLDAGCKTADMWGFVESQETSSVSPEMYNEFIFPYHKKITDRFGLNCYGCCEPFDPRWKYVSQIHNLRRVSCSPWSNRKVSPQLLGNKYISSYKLMPTPLASHNMDEEEVRRNLREVLDYCQGTIPELIMKDNNTLGNNPHNADRWVELAREEIART